MRTLLLPIFVISLACWACGPISDWPHGAEDQDGPAASPGGTSDAGSSAVSDGGLTPQQDAGGAGPVGGGSSSMDAGAPAAISDAATQDPCRFDAGDAATPDAGDAQSSEGLVGPAAIDAGWRAPFRPFPQWWPDAWVPDARAAPADAAQSDAESDVAHPTAAPSIPCW